MDESLQCAQVVGFVGTDQTDRVTHGIGPPGAADPMDVVFGSRRKIEVHHVRDAVHIDAPGRDVGRHENAHGSALELGQGPQTLVLRPVGMQRRGADPTLLEPPGDPIGPVLHAGEHQHHFEGGIAEQLLQQGGLEMTRHLVDRLGDRLGRIGTLSDLDRLR